MDADEDSDAGLLGSVAAGDKRALAAILQRHAPSVTRYAWALVEHPADVEEVVQDTFVTCWRKADSIVLADSSLLPWLLATCRNLSWNLNRALARRATDELPADIAFMSQDEDSRDRLRWVMDEIDQLSALDRRVCELCLIDGRTYAEAADEMGITVGAVRQRVSRSRGRLRRAVIDNEE